MIRIKSEVNSDGRYIVDLRGRYVSEGVIARLRDLDAVKRRTFKTNFSITYHERGVLNNEALIIFEEGARKVDVNQIVDVIEMALHPHIGTAFCEIKVSPYHVAYSGDSGGLTLCIEIAKETDCRFDGGAWNEPVTFFPSNSIQYNQIVELLETFGMRYT